MIKRENVRRNQGNKEKFWKEKLHLREKNKK